MEVKIDLQNLKENIVKIINPEVHSEGIVRDQYGNIKNTQKEEKE